VKNNKPEIIYRTPSGQLIGYDKFGRQITVDWDELDPDTTIGEAPWMEDEGEEDEIH
jgi:hypothetical protein